jgi:ABC-type uncharacterized transport system auxiliary subunit
MKKAAVCLIGVVLAAACGSAPAKRYFQVSIVGTAARPMPEIDRSLALEASEVDPLYDDTRILYRVSPFELEYYPYEFWAENPGRLVDNALTDFFLKARVFSRVVEASSGEEADIRLRPSVVIIEEVDGAAAWEAHLAMRLEFVDAASGKPLVTRSFDRREKMKAKDVKALPPALSSILHEELAQAVAELAAVLSKTGAGD